MSGKRSPKKRSQRTRSPKTRGGQRGGLQGMSPKQMQRALGQIDTQDLSNVEEVIVRTPNEEIVLENPEVTIMNMGQEIWSVIPKKVTRNPRSLVEDTDDPVEEIEIKEDDVSLIMSTTNVSKKAAIAALKKNNGDIAAAIMSLSEV